MCFKTIPYFSDPLNSKRQLIFSEGVLDKNRLLRFSSKDTDIFQNLST